MRFCPPRSLPSGLILALVLGTGALAHAADFRMQWINSSECDVTVKMLKLDGEVGNLNFADSDSAGMGQGKNLLPSGAKAPAGHENSFAASYIIRAGKTAWVAYDRKQGNIKLKFELSHSGPAGAGNWIVQSEGGLADGSVVPVKFTAADTLTATRFIFSTKTLREKTEFGENVRVELRKP